MSQKNPSTLCSSFNATLDENKEKIKHGTDEIMLGLFETLMPLQHKKLKNFKIL
jgi:hypothetical protein